MNFLDYIFSDRRANRAALLLFIGFALFYGLINIPYVNYMAENAGLLGDRSPFNTRDFPLNLFNFDPSMYYGMNSSSVIHPLISYLTVVLGEAQRCWAAMDSFLCCSRLSMLCPSCLCFCSLPAKGRN